MNIWTEYQTNREHQKDLAREAKRSWLANEAAHSNTKRDAQQQPAKKING